MCGRARLQLDCQFFGLSLDIDSLVNLSEATSANLLEHAIVACDNVTYDSNNHLPYIFSFIFVKL